MQCCIFVPRRDAQGRPAGAFFLGSKMTEAAPWGARLEPLRALVSIISLTYLLEFMLLPVNSTIQPLLVFIDNCSLVAALLAAVSGGLLASWQSWLDKDGDPAVNRLMMNMALWSFLFTLFTLVVCVLLRSAIAIVANMVHVGADGQPFEPHVSEMERRRRVLAEIKTFPIYGAPLVLTTIALCFLVVWALLFARSWMAPDFVWITAWSTICTLATLGFVLFRFLRLRRASRGARRRAPRRAALTPPPRPRPQRRS